MLLDTCVLIDLLRGKENATDFILGLPDVSQVSVITVTELLAGVRNTKERRQIEQLFAHYDVVPIDLDVAVQAGDYVKVYGKSHSVDPMDAYIAATAKVHQLELATLKLKHFPMFPDLKRPYG